MPDNPENSSILSQLDDSEKGDIITDEELEEIGAAYGSRERYEETMRTLAERLSGTQMGRGDYVAVGNRRASSRVKAGTSTVPLGKLPKVKRINIVGKVINYPGDAARLFSSFRDPRIEVFNIAYVSNTGRVLAHTALTYGLPSLTPISESKTNGEGFYRIKKTIEKLGADKIWISHNHPSGNPTPSKEDIKATEAYVAYFKDSFAGHVILDHKDYSLYLHKFYREGSFGSRHQGYFERQTFKKHSKYYVKERKERREHAAAISNPEDIAGIFKRVLTKNEDTTAFAILDGQHRVVSWLYGGDNSTDEIKNYMRAAGGNKVIVITNSGSLYDKYCFRADKALDSKYDIYIDTVLVNKKTGNLEKAHSNEDTRHGASWQYEEALTANPIKYLINNKTIQPELVFGTTPLLTKQDKNFKENIMSDVNTAFEQNSAADQKLSPRELAFRDMTWQSKVIVDALKNGTSSCLPGPDGYADTSPAINLVNGTYYHGANMLYLKEHQKQHGFPTAEYATAAQIDRARENNPGLHILKDQKGVSIHFSEQNSEGEYIDKNVRLFNVAQLNKPAQFKKWAEDERLVNIAEYHNYKRSVHGDAYKPPELKEKGHGPEIVCKSTEPSKYLGQYLAAVSMGGQFKASPEQGKEFAQKMVDSLYEKTIIAKSGKRQGEYIEDPFKLTKISREASVHCKETIKELRSGPKVSQKQEQKQKKGRSL